MGVGTALLMRLLRLVRDLGFARASLDVDADSLTSATRLYERIGFRRVRGTIDMEKELRTGITIRTQTVGAA